MFDATTTLVNNRGRAQIEHQLRSIIILMFQSSRTTFIASRNQIYINNTNEFVLFKIALLNANFTISSFQK